MKTQTILTILLLATTAILAACSSGASHAGPGETFATCVTESGAKMYGAYWCPHCQNQKEAFGTSWEFINYVECSLPNRAGQTAICQRDNIQSYPTWEFADGSRQTGELSFEALSEATGCQLGE